MTYLSCFFACFLLVLAYPTAKTDNVVGIWWTDDKNARIEIENRNGKYWGKIVWVRDPYESNGKLKVDSNNPDKSQRTNPIVGVTLLKGFEFVDGEWKNGKIYNPENGKDYSGILTLKNKNTLEVRGYLGFSFVGLTTVWTRYE